MKPKDPTRRTSFVTSRSAAGQPVSRPPRLEDLPETLPKWEAYRRARTDQARNAFLEYYMPLVRFHADRLASRLPPEVAIDDLVSEGTFGLIDAINGFEPARGYKFSTYSAPRIRGAMLDYVRANDWVPRQVRTRSGKVNGARDALRDVLGREPTDEELRRELGLDPEMFRRFVKDATVAGTISLSRQWFETDSNKYVCEIDTIHDRRVASPDAAVSSRDAVDTLLRDVQCDERLILGLYHIEELPMKQAAGALGISESRVSQINKNLLARLFATLTRDPDRVCSIMPDLTVDHFTVHPASIDLPPGAAQGRDERRSPDARVEPLRARRHARCNRRRH